MSVFIPALFCLPSQYGQELEAAAEAQALQMSMQCDTPGGADWTPEQHALLRNTAMFGHLQEPFAAAAAADSGAAPDTPPAAAAAVDSMAAPAAGARGGAGGNDRQSAGSSGRRARRVTPKAAALHVEGLPVVKRGRGRPRKIVQEVRLNCGLACVTPCLCASHPGVMMTTAPTCASAVKHLQRVLISLVGGTNPQ